MNLLTVLVISGIGIATFVISNVNAFKEFGKKKDKGEVQNVSKIRDKQHA